MLPHFLIPGAGKSGTTSLVHWLAQHPGVFVPEKKEPAFFSTIRGRGNYHRGLEWYESQFRMAEPEQVAGEASTLYMYDPASPHLIKKHLGDPQLVFVLRHPVDRAYSNYWQDIKRGVRLRDFGSLMEDVDLADYDTFRPDLFDPRQRGWAYLYASDYGKHVARFLEHFSRERMLFLTFDDLRRNASAVASRALAFLGLDPELMSGDLPVKNPSTLPLFPALERLFKVQVLRGAAERLAPWTKPLAIRVREINQRPFSYPPMSTRTSALLNEFFRDRVIALERQINIDLSEWQRSG